MGRFHRHDGHDPHHLHDHAQGHDHGEAHGHDVGDHTGYSETGTVRIEVLESILSENDRVAAENRAAFDRHGVTAVNVMSSPGAGKTTLLRRTIPALAVSRRVGVVEGDIATSIDADALRGLGAQVSLVNTSAGFGGECHLDAVMVRAGLGRLDLDALDVVLVENVGNLVCPAEFDVGAHARAMVFSVTEGEDKPLKYPVMFRAADVVVINKIDLLPHLQFGMDTFLSNLRAVNPRAEIIHASTRTGDGLDEWMAWLTTLAGARGEEGRATADR